MLRQGAVYLAGFLSGLLATAAILLMSSPPRGHPIELKPIPTLPPIQVHVAGAVEEPGVYQLPREAIVEEAIAAAGGPSEQAALDLLNLAKPLSDGQQIHVPDQSLLTETGEAGISPASISGESDLLNLNEATEPELERLPGIGPSLAQAIVKYRQQHGPFENVDALMNVPGIGPAKLEAVRDLVEVN